MDSADLLRANGLRATRPRVLVLSTVDDLDHPTVEQVFQAAGRHELARSTVYRAVEALEHAGILCGASLPSRERIYHLRPEFDHAHVVCSHCGTVCDRPGPYGAQHCQELNDDDFTLERVEVVGIGRCLRC